jgi:hypothetical protein
MVWFFQQFTLNLCIDKKIKDMTNSIEVLKAKEVLTADEAKEVFKADFKWATEYLFNHHWNNTYLNLDVYSEAEKERIDLEKEMGI